MKPFGEVSLVRSNESLICLCNGWDGATNDVGAPENRFNVLTPQDNDILPGIWTGGHRPPFFKKFKIILLYLKLLSMRNAC